MMFAAVNVFYAFYGVTQGNLVNTLIPTFTFMILVYSAVILDEKAESERLKG
jgi:hypothetical protein